MTSILPRFTLSSTNKAKLTSSRLPDFRRQEPPHPSDPKICPWEQSNDEHFPPENSHACSHLTIPSPTYRFMFTPEFLIHSWDSEDGYSDGLSPDVIETESAISSNIAQQDLPPWSSRAEYVKSLVNRFIGEEIRQQNSVRLTWRSGLTPTPTTTCRSWETSSDSQTALDSTDAQSSFWVSSNDQTRNRISGKNNVGFSLRHTKSLADLSTRRLSKTSKLPGPGPFSSPTSFDVQINKNSHIRSWVSAVVVTHR